MRDCDQNLKMPEFHLSYLACDSSFISSVVMLLIVIGAPISPPKYGMGLRPFIRAITALESGWHLLFLTRPSCLNAVSPLDASESALRHETARRSRPPCTEPMDS